MRPTWGPTTNNFVVFYPPLSVFNPSNPRQKSLRSEETEDHGVTVAAVGIASTRSP